MDRSSVRRICVVRSDRVESCLRRAVRNPEHALLRVRNRRELADSRSGTAVSADSIAVPLRSLTTRASLQLKPIHSHSEVPKGGGLVIQAPIALHHALPGSLDWRRSRWTNAPGADTGVARQNEQTGDRKYDSRGRRR